MQGIGLPAVVARTIDDAGRLQLSLQLDCDLPCFAGHFPGLAVLPGVAQLAWAVHFAAAQWQLPALIAQAEVLKFQKLARPPMLLTLQLEKRGDKVLFSFDSEQGRHASGRLAYGAP